MFARMTSAAFAAAAAVVLSGCAPTATSVATNVTGGANMNGGLPSKATIFYLTSTSAFNSADYGSLATNPAAALGADLLGSQSVLLRPGETKMTARSFDGEGPTAVGVIVGFKAIGSAQWRASTPIKQGGANTLTVSIGSGSVSISK